MRLCLFIPVAIVLALVRLVLSVMVELPARIAICACAVFDTVLERFELWARAIDDGQLYHGAQKYTLREHFVRAWKNINV